MTDRIKLVYDMETGDPDDALTLCVLATHPRVELRAVTVHPGSPDQVWLVKYLLRTLEREDVPVGAGTPKKPGSRVSMFHYSWIGRFPSSELLETEADGPAADIILKAIEQGADTLLTGAALTNVYQAYLARRDGFFKRWVCQGGFAGDNIVPPEYRLPKFAGRLTCPTYNLGGDRKAALALTQATEIPVKQFVSKNVCHGVIWDQEKNNRIPDNAHPGLDLLKEGMRVYFRKHTKDGKALHDTVAAMCMVYPQIAEWEEGELYYHKGEWGFSRPDCLTLRPAHRITVKLDVPMFEKALSGQL